MKPEDYAGDTEHSQQTALFMWINQEAIPNDPTFRMIFAVPNGGLRHKATAGRLKAEGVRSGVPDIFCAVPREGEMYRRRFMFHGLFIEMKRPKGGRTEPEQDDWHQRLVNHGYKVVTCRNWIDARNELLMYLRPAPDTPASFWPAPNV